MAMSTDPDHAAEAGGPDIGREVTMAAERSLEGNASVRPRGRVARERIGRYRVLAVLGSGGMGRVYEAVDERLGRSVAVKVLQQHLSEQHRQRLVREAQALARLSHPNVVHVYEIEEDDGETFVAMELVRGQTLQEWVQQDPRPSWRACVEVYRQAGAGLSAAHAEGLVHRDFKPGNAIIDAKGRVRVLDFGLVRQADEDEPEEAPRPAVEGVGDVIESCLTTTGTLLGTPAYMPPEQMSGREVDARGDQFSFCVALYEAVYGERPFKGASLQALMVAVMAGHVLPVPKGTAVPAKLRQVLLRGLAREPQGRWPTMEALLAELDGQLAPRSARWLAVGGAGALVAVGLAAGWYASRSRPIAEDPTVMKALDVDEQEAAFLYESGAIAYRQGLYDDAVAKWSRSFELSRSPLLLYNLSMALEQRHELTGELQDLLRARSVMQNFLIIAEIDPELGGAEDARARIAELDARIAEAKANPAAPRRTPAPR
jgi:predicted Ser/Thr protein kinase